MIPLKSSAAFCGGAFLRPGQPFFRWSLETLGILADFSSYDEAKYDEGVKGLKGYIEDRAIELATYIIRNNATVRDAATKYSVSKSTVHTVRVT